MNHASLFSGIGGFDLAAREVGWNNVFQCEIDPFCQSVLKYYFPKTVLYEDIKRTDFTSWKGKIDVLTGGFPCQPFSVAGQRKGAVEIMRVAPAGWYRYDLVWHKTTPTGFLNAKKYPLRNHELILIFSPMPLGKHTYNPQKTYGHVRKVSKASSKVGCKETELYGKAGLTTYDSTERYPLSVMTFKTDRQKSAIHPNQKPVELLRYLIRTYTNPGDAVMDPVAGSGTTGIAAYEEGRDSLLVEIDRQFFDEMINRFNNNNIKIDRI